MGKFRFKQFEVCDDRATMKVGTDAVLLGAWADVGQAKTILDIGTGSGVIALMMAQRTSAEAKIDAVELLKQDAEQALQNTVNSPWPGKISVVNTPLQDFFPETKYDLILCNPPFFSKSLLPGSEKRTAVRHDTALTQDQLIESVVNLLSPSGKFCVIFPPTESEVFISKARGSQLFLHHLTRFFTRQEKIQERSLLEFESTAGHLREDRLVLYESGNQWSKEYRTLTQDFYLGQ